MLENRLVPWRRHSAVPTAMPSLFGDLQDEVNRLFEDFWGEARPAGAETRALSPRVDVAEQADAYRISAELPGLKEDEVELALDDDVLTIKGEHKVENEREEAQYHVRERRWGSFQRSFRLPPTADTAKISAKFDNGVLEIAVPKRPEAKAESRRIAIGKG